MDRRAKAAAAFDAWRDPGADRPPWLGRVSPDGTKWVIRDPRGRNRPECLDLNLAFPDGTALTDPNYAPLLDVARAYVPLVRLHMPSISCTVHAERVKALLTFIFWLQLQGVRRLEDVTRDHLRLYADQARHGREWATEAPHRVLAYLRGLFLEDRSPPLAPRYCSRFGHRAIYKAADAAWPSGGHRYRSAVVRWFEDGGPAEGRIPDLGGLLHDMKVEVRPITAQAVLRLLGPIEEVWLWKEHLPPGDGLPFQPFERGASVWARRRGVKSGRHRSPPPEVAFQFLNHCAQWVKEIGPIAATIGAANSDPSRLRSALGRLTPLKFIEDTATMSVDQRRIGPHGVARLLSAACFAIIAALTARRLGEVLDLGAGRVTEDAEGHWWLRTYIEKTLQDYDLIPVPALVAEVIECMEALSKDARALGSDSLWQWRHPDGAVRKLHPHNDLNLLASAGAEGTPRPRWGFTAHQFRRFFALLYFWRYDKPDLPALALHLRHTELEMTHRYVTDTDFQRVEEEARSEHETQLLRDIVHGRRTVGGHAGHKLNEVAKRLVSHFQRSVKVLPEEAAVKYLTRLKKKWGADYKQHVWGTVCACPKSSSMAKHARCRDGEPLGPVYANASEAKCGVCPFAIQTERFQEAAEAARQGALNRAALAPDSILATAARGDVERLETVVSEGRPPPGLEAVGRQQR